MKHYSRIAAPFLTLLLLVSPAFADDTSSADVAALKEQIAKLSQKVDQMEIQAKKAKAAAAVAPVAAPAPVAAAAPAAPAASDVVTKGTFPGSFHIPGTDTSVKIGGYIKLDANVDAGEGDGTPFAKYAAIPLSNSVQKQQGEQTTFGAQQSRLNLETHTDTSLGLLKTYLETDFYNGNAATNSNLNGYGIQLRHAYGALGTSSSDMGQVLAGQTWTNFQDTDAVSESLDYLGASGRVFVRQAQIRYTKDVGPVTASASVEAAIGNDSAFSTPTNVTTIGTGTGTGRGTYPDMTLRGDYHYAPDGYVSLRGLVSEINIDKTVGTANETASKMGYGVGFSGKQAVMAKDNFHYDINYGRGTGRYVYDIGTGSAYYNATNGSLELQEWYTANAGYQHFWSNQFRSNVFAGFVRNLNNLDFMGADAALANKYVASGSVNLIWQPATAYSVGVEYMHGYREVESGVEGNLNRIETSFQYNF